MPTPTAPPRPSAARAARPAPAERPVGSLHLRPPGWRREPVVGDVLAEMTAGRADELARARKVIAEHGLSIEVARLRERLSRAPVSDLGRLLLATPGVPEQLFLAAIEEQLGDEVRAEKAETEGVRDDSVTEMGKLLSAAIERLGDALLKGQSGHAAATPKQPDVTDANDSGSPSARKPPSTTKPGGPR